MGKDGAGEKGMVYGHCEETYGRRCGKEGWAKRRRGWRVEEGAVVQEQGKERVRCGDWDFIFSLNLTLNQL